MTENRGLFTLDGAQAYLAAEPKMTTEMLSDRLYTVTDGQVRTLFVEAQNSVIAFDTFGTPGHSGGSPQQACWHYPLIARSLGSRRLRRRSGAQCRDNR